MKRLLCLLLVACSKEPPPPLPAPVIKLPIPIELDAGVIEFDAGEPEPHGPGVTYTTRFRNSGESAARAQNIRLVASKFQTLHVKEGAEFSFNAVVGPRTAEAGFVLAPTFYEGVHVDALGGGICQVSSTLYAALMHGAYDVTEWHSHSRKVPYIPEGMDATVNWPDLDLKFVPDQDVWITVVVERDDDPNFSKLSAVVSGGWTLRPAVRTRWAKREPTPYMTKTIHSPYIKKMKVHRKGEIGEPGFRIWQWGDTVLHREANYAPVQEVLIVPIEPESSQTGPG